MLNRPVLRRRRAARFALLTDETDGGRSARWSSDPRLRKLVALANRLRATGSELEIDPTFRVKLRAKLITAAIQDGVGTTARPGLPICPHQHRRALVRTKGRRLRLAVLAGIAAGSLGFVGIAQASEEALPGQWLYEVKRSTEQLQLAQAGSDFHRGQFHLDWAQRRLAEAAVSRTGQRKLLADMEHDTLRGVYLLTTAVVERQRPAALDAIDSFTTEQRNHLRRFIRDTTGIEQMQAASALQLLDRIDQRVAYLRQHLVCADLLLVGVDELGPELAGCRLSFSAPSLRPLARGEPPAPAPAPTPASPNVDQPGGPATSDTPADWGVPPSTGVPAVPPARPTSPPGLDRAREVTPELPPHARPASALILPPLVIAAAPAELLVNRTYQEG